MSSSSAYPISEREYSPTPVPNLNYPPSTSRSSPAYSNSPEPIIIDNGSSELRAGFSSSAINHSSSSNPNSYTYESWSNQPPLTFDNVTSKWRDRKKNQSVLLVGKDAFVDQHSRSFIRSPFDHDVVCHFDVFENVLDYTFSKLGINTETVQHPILMSETLCNPSYTRGLTNELFFETYGAPSVSYGLDSLFSAYQNGIKDNGLLINSGKFSTTLVPLVNGRPVISSAKRLSWGGAQASDHLLRLFQLKYPTFPLRLTPTQATNLLETQTFCSNSYFKDLSDCSNSLAGSERLGIESIDRIIQFPIPISDRNPKTEEELKLQEEKRKESGRRLREQQAKARFEKIMEKERNLEIYTALKEEKKGEKKGDWQKKLEAQGFSTETELDEQIKKITTSLKRSRAKDLGIEFEEEAQEIPDFSLVSIPDHQLDEESIKEKRRLRLMKAGYDARIRMKEEKLEAKRREEEERIRDEEFRNRDLDGWRLMMRKNLEDTIERMKERKQKKEMLSNRKSLAAQQRMKNITALASDVPEKGPKRKRRKAGDEDDFGADDADWGVYREIRGADDSEDEEEDSQTLKTIEAKLLQYDPNFNEADTFSSKQLRKNKLTNTFLRGSNRFHFDVSKSIDPSGGDAMDLDMDVDLEELKKSHQLHMNIERFKVPEILFQPHLAGVDQAGLDEISAHILNGFENSIKEKMLKNVFLTGRHTLYPNLDQRLQSSIQSTQPYNFKVSVSRARDARFDAWRGMAKWSNECKDRFLESMTKAQYDEFGSEYFKDHEMSGSEAL